MLKSLSIKNFAIIEKSVLELSSGLTVLTGETGAGKSILLDAMGLILGERADSNMVRHGTNKADITAVFDLSAQQEIQNILEELDLEAEQNECYIRRVINHDGKSKAYINGVPCTLATLKKVVENLVNIHGQHDHQLLTQSHKQITWLDQQLPNQDLLQQVKSSYKHWNKANKLLNDTVQNHQQQTDDLERYQFLLQELQSLAPELGEIEKIEAEHIQQSNAEQLISHAQSAYQSLTIGKASVLNQLSSCLADIQSIESVDVDSGLSSTFIEQALIELQDQSSEIKRYLNQVEIDPQRLAYLESRIGSFENLAFKHHCPSEQLYLKLNELSDKIDLIENADKNIDTLKKEVAKKASIHRPLALKLSQIRQQTAQQLSQSISQIMQQLSMIGGQFKIDVQHQPEQAFSAKGNDVISFLVSANPGQPLKELKKVASGGELSRISLAMQMVANKDSQIATLIFDEVDAGIGGETANVVGKLLRKLGNTTQSLCVTHLPQVAAQGHNHLLVKKTIIDNQTHTQLKQLNNEKRINEIARMLAGDLTDNSIQHAKEMLNS